MQTRYFDKCIVFFLRLVFPCDSIICIKFHGYNLSHSVAPQYSFTVSKITYFFLLSLIISAKSHVFFVFLILVHRLCANVLSLWAYMSRLYAQIVSATGMIRGCSGQDSPLLRAVFVIGDWCLCLARLLLLSLTFSGVEIPLD